MDAVMYTVIQSGVYFSKIAHPMLLKTISSEIGATKIQYSTKFKVIDAVRAPVKLVNDKNNEPHAVKIGVRNTVSRSIRLLGQISPSFS